MKRVFLFLIMAILLALLALVAYDVYTHVPADPAGTTAATTAPETVPQVTPPQTQPTTEAVTIPVIAPPPPAVMPEDYELTARHAFVYDCGREQLVYTLGDQHQTIAPASLTKLLTIYTALQHVSPDLVVTAGDETGWVDPASSLALVADGDQLTVAQLIEGMLLQSGNDAAYALAVAVGRVLHEEEGIPSGIALDTFLEEMNRQAAVLGLENTHFETPDGLDADGHFSTPADMLKLTQVLMEDPMIMGYAGIAKETVTFADGTTRDWTNTNYLLHPESPYYCPEACGLKTGYTSKAGACMIAIFHTGGRHLIVGVFGATHYEQRAADALWLYEQFR